MAQQELATIDLEPIGGRKVSAEELGQTVKNILTQLENLKKGASADGPAADLDQPDTSSLDFNYSELKKYAIYTGSGIVGLYLIGKALQ